jgi:aminopeptidase
MHDARFDKLAKLLVEYSIRLKRNETVLIETFDIPDEMTVALIRAVQGAGGVPFAQVYHARVNRALALEASDRQLNLVASHELARMKKMNAYIAVRGSHNITELSDVPPAKIAIDRQKNAAGAGPTRQKDQMGRLALAYAVDGTACRDEHGSV